MAGLDIEWRLGRRRGPEKCLYRATIPPDGGASPGLLGPIARTGRVPRGLPSARAIPCPGRDENSQKAMRRTQATTSKCASFTHYRNRVLAGERRDPNIVQWDRLARPSQFHPDFRVFTRCGRGDGRDPGRRQVRAEPFLVARSRTRTPNSGIVLAKRHTGNHQLAGGSECGFDRRKAFRPGGIGIRIEDHSRSLGQTVSNSSPIRRRICRFSSDSSARAPNPAIHGASEPVTQRLSFSSTASVRRRSTVTPRLAAKALARRSVVSGSLTVVFKHPFPTSMVILSIPPGRLLVPWKGVARRQLPARETALKVHDRRGGADFLTCSRRTDRSRGNSPSPGRACLRPVGASSSRIGPSDSARAARRQARSAARSIQGIPVPKLPTSWETY